ncbi:putative alkaline shock family protein YloU [Williamsia muralis]|uniref:Putative alkaline shock family protein YloU n=1 Tax=Williamsia marianensis TaxID=85044 RepID=A0A495K7W9_WILMA|nr:Asp23/Gls24 family envelope stress response protein [Williamsia muralis]RKR97386.1 putative alkaline shock family protein YloU [Williamsia muralis]
MADSADATARADRGTLVIADRVAAKIATRAALSVDAVVRHHSGLGAVVGATYPQVRVDMAPSAGPQFMVIVALRWPSAVAEVCRQVRRQVAHDMNRLTGLAPSRVDVSVAQMISSSGRHGGHGIAGRSHARLVELPTAEGEREYRGVGEQA